MRGPELFSQQLPLSHWAPHCAVASNGFIWSSQQPCMVGTYFVDKWLGTGRTRIRAQKVFSMSVLSPLLFPYLTWAPSSGFSITLTSFGRIPWPQAGVGTCPSPQSWVSPFLQPHREHHYAKTSSRSQPSPQSLALCLAYSRCPVNTCQMTDCISPASGCHQALREPGRSEESFWIPATPHISSIFSES